MGRIRYLVVAAVALLTGAAVTTGLAVATASTPSVKACTTTAGYLKLATAGGACPSGSTAVTINERGPRGIPGQSPLSAVLDRTTPGGDAEITLPKGDRVELTCGSDDGVPAPIVTVAAKTSTDTYYVHGTASVQSGGSVSYSDGSNTQVFSPGTALIGQSPVDYFRFGALATGAGAAYGSVRVLVNDGADVFTLDVSLYSATNRCQAIVEATPAA